MIAHIDVMCVFGLAAARPLAARCSSYLRFHLASLPLLCLRNDGIVRSTTITITPGSMASCDRGQLGGRTATVGLLSCWSRAMCDVCKGHLLHGARHRQAVVDFVSSASQFIKIV